MEELINWFQKQLDIHACGSEAEETEASKLIDLAHEEEFKHNIGFSLVKLHVHGFVIFGKQFKWDPHLAFIIGKGILKQFQRWSRVRAKGNKRQAFWL